tara:strand:+ start:49 stop:339 length:291 start_codon:yes stop_codon:yes gene_type:complete
MTDLCARFYDNGGETFDRYTIVYLEPKNNFFHYVGASENPFDPQGFGLWSEHKGCPVDHLSKIPDVGGTNHLGKRILFAQLPEDVQKLVLQDLTPD